MEPTDLTCAKCGTSWKLIKAGDGPIACPSCKAPVGEPPAQPVSPTPADAPPLVESPVPPNAPAPEPTVVTQRPRPADARSDHDDRFARSLRRRAADVEPRRRWHPLVTVGLILLLLLMVPVVLVALFFAVCAYSFG